MRNHGEREAAAPASPLGALRDAGVDFVLVGGLAVNAWGYLRATRDVDLVPEPSNQNLARLDALLVELGGKVEVGELGHVDVLQGLSQVPGFSSLNERASELDIDGLVVKVCSREDLLKMKRASDRPRDRDDLEALEAAGEGRTPEAG